MAEKKKSPPSREYMESEVEIWVPEDSRLSVHFDDPEMAEVFAELSDDELFFSTDCKPDDGVRKMTVKECWDRARNLMDYGDEFGLRIFCAISNELLFDMSEEEEKFFDIVMGPAKIMSAVFNGDFSGLEYEGEVHLYDDFMKQVGNGRILDTRVQDRCAGADDEVGYVVDYS